jgi:hypothetical protein
MLNGIKEEKTNNGGFDKTLGHWADLDMVLLGSLIFSAKCRRADPNENPARPQSFLTITA